MNHLPSRRTTLRMRPLALAIIATCGGLAAFTAAPARADDASADNDRARRLETIEVEGHEPAKPTSPKFTAPLLDTPQTIAVIPDTVFRAQGAQNLTEVLRNTPGISFDAGENGFSTNNNNFSLRGFDTSGSIFIDGVRDSGNYPRDVFNIEQVEVAKGAAADNGRGGLAGYVNLVTKSPQLADFTRGSGSLGVDGTDAENRLRATFDINRQVGEGSAVRVNLLAQDGGIAGRDHATSEAKGIAPSIAFGLNGDTRFSISAQYLEQRGRPDWGVPGAMISGTVNYDANAAAADRGSFYGLASDYDNNLSKSALARIEHEFNPNLLLSNQTRWAATKREALYTVPFGYTAATQMVVGQTQAYQRENSMVSNLTNLTSRFQTGSVQHSLTAGLEVSRESSDALRFGTSTPPETPVGRPDLNRVSSLLPAASQSNRVDIDTVAAYVYDTMEFSERWQLTGGFRAERYDVEIESKTAAGAPQGPDGYSISDTTVSGKLGLVFKPTENGSVYASFGLAALPPGSWLSNPDISRTGDNAFPGLVGQNNEQAKTQSALNYELGVKWNFFDDRLLASAAAFRTERRDVAISGRNPNDPSNTAVTLQGYGQQNVTGVELGITGQITEAWSIFAGAVLLDSEREHSAFLDEARRLANPADYGTWTTTSGNELAFTAKRTANLWTTYRFDNGLTIGGGAQHVGDSWAGRPDDADRIIPNGRYGRLPGYTVANLMASYAFNDNFTMRLNVDNVTDRFYASSGNWAMTRVFVGAPRTYLLSADFSF